MGIDPRSGLGGVSLSVPDAWSLVAYLCVGWPLNTHQVPELERTGWQPREATCRKILQR